MADFLNATNLDFSTLKNAFRDYLKNQDNFKDINYEGSNINVLLDVIAYNTYLNALYLNMVGSEMFMDSAVVRDTIISHSKELNYLPRSRSSSKAKIQLTATVNDPSLGEIVIPKNTSFTALTTQNNKSYNTQYNFVTRDNAILQRISATEFTGELDIYEGTYITEYFNVNGSMEQRFVISNKEIDTESIILTVQASQSDTSNTLYSYTQTLYNLNSDSTVYFLQAYFDDKYEIIFGDNVFGKHPISPNIVKVEYMITNGEPANGASNFKFNGFSGSEKYSFAVTKLENSRAGSDRETNTSIKYRAPRHYQTQYRAVTSEDYKTLIQANFNDIKAVNVYGGETLDEPQYGRVFVSASTTSGEGLSEFTKTEIIQYLKTRTPLSIDVFYIDPSYLYLIVNSTITYKLSLTTNPPNIIKSMAVNAIENFTTTYLNDFDKDFHYSKFVAAIDNSDSSILSNETDIIMAKDYVPLIGQNLIFTIEFRNPIRKDDNIQSRPLTNEFTLYSSNFVYNGVTASFGEDGAGNIFVYEYTNSGRKILKSNCGTVNYDTGKISINSIIIDSYENDAIRFFAIPRNKDIIVRQDTIISVDIGSLNIDVESE
jgi:hypothetical protein